MCQLDELFGVYYTLGEREEFFLHTIVSFWALGSKLVLGDEKEIIVPSSSAWETVCSFIRSGPWWGNSSVTISGYKQLIFNDWTWFPIMSKNSFRYNLYMVKLWRNRMVFLRLWMTVLGKWYVFKCFRACSRPFRVSWSPFFILHRLSSFRSCSLDLHVFTVFSTSSVITFFPGKLSINFRSCSKVRFRCPMCLRTLFSQRSMSEWSKNRDIHSHSLSKATTELPRGKGSSPAFHNLKADLLLSFEGGLRSRYWELSSILFCVTTE